MGKYTSALCILLQLALLGKFNQKVIYIKMKYKSFVIEPYTIYNNVDEIIL